MGLLGVMVGGVTGWLVARRRQLVDVARGTGAKRPPAHSSASSGSSSAAEATNGADADQETVIDLRETPVVSSLRSELREARERIEELETINDDLREQVRRKDLAVAEARHTLESVRDSLASGELTRPVVQPVAARLEPFPPEDGSSDLRERLEAVTGELAEVTRRHRIESDD